MSSTHPPSTLAYLNHLYAEPRREGVFKGTGASEFADYAVWARPELARRIGLDAIRESTQDATPSVTLGTAKDLGNYTRAKGVLRSEPHLDIPFWFLKPKGDGPFPIGLFPHGHNRIDGLDYAVGIAATAEIREKIETEDRAVAIEAVRRGMAAIAPSTRGFHPACVADITGRHGGRDCQSQFIHALLAGRSVIGERVWDLQRLLDWAESRPDLDTSRTFVMGNSGGGVASLYAAACDERIHAAIASCSFCSYVGKNGVVHHCDCNTVPGILTFGEFHDVAGLIAPRRLLVVHGKTDPHFPPDKVKRSVERLRERFANAGAGNSFHHAWGPGGHRFYGDRMWPWLEKNLGTSP